MSKYVNYDEFHQNVRLFFFVYSKKKTRIIFKRLYSMCIYIMPFFPFLNFEYSLNLYESQRIR